jgi:hypothetical protein
MLAQKVHPVAAQALRIVMTAGRVAAVLHDPRLRKPERPILRPDRHHVFEEQIQAHHSAQHL